MNDLVTGSHALMDNLSGAQKRIALKAIEEVHLAYFEKGGLRDTVEKARGQADGVSTHIYKLAVYAAKSHEELDKAADLFRTLCAYAESQYKEAHGLENLKGDDDHEGLPVWPVFKSNILGAMRSGLSPLEYKNEHALRNARMEKMRELAPPRRSEEEPIGPQTIEDFIARTAMSDDMKELASDTLLRLEFVRPSKTEQAMELVQRVNEELGQLVDKKRMREASTSH
jgi:hypothetical protein